MYRYPYSTFAVEELQGGGHVSHNHGGLALSEIFPKHTTDS